MPRDAKVREVMGLQNVKLMVPFCRTIEEGRRVIAEMAGHGLVQGERGLEIYVMCEIPSNVTLAADFAGVRWLLHRQQRRRRLMSWASIAIPSSSRICSMNATTPSRRRSLR